jgi:hypothetical protein
LDNWPTILSGSPPSRQEMSALQQCDQKFCEKIANFIQKSPILGKNRQFCEKIANFIQKSPILSKNRQFYLKISLMEP